MRTEFILPLTCIISRKFSEIGQNQSKSIKYLQSVLLVQVLFIKRFRTPNVTFYSPPSICSYSNTVHFNHIGIFIISLSFLPAAFFPSLFLFFPCSLDIRTYDSSTEQCNDYLSCNFTHFFRMLYTRFSLESIVMRCVHAMHYIAIAKEFVPVLNGSNFSQILQLYAIA